MSRIVVVAALASMVLFSSTAIAGFIPVGFFNRIYINGADSSDVPLDTKVKDIPLATSIDESVTLPGRAFASTKSLISATRISIRLMVDAIGTVESLAVSEAIFHLRFEVDRPTLAHLAGNLTYERIDNTIVNSMFHIAIPEPPYRDIFEGFLLDPEVSPSRKTIIFNETQLLHPGTQYIVGLSGRVDDLEGHGTFACDISLSEVPVVPLPPAFFIGGLTIIVGAVAGHVRFRTVST